MSTRPGCRHLLCNDTSKHCLVTWKKKKEKGFDVNAIKGFSVGIQNMLFTFYSHEAKISMQLNPGLFADINMTLFT